MLRRILSGLPASKPDSHFIPSVPLSVESPTCRSVQRLSRQIQHGASFVRSFEATPSTRREPGHSSHTALLSSPFLFFSPSSREVNRRAGSAFSPGRFTTAFFFSLASTHELLRHKAPPPSPCVTSCPGHTSRSRPLLSANWEGPILERGRNNSDLSFHHRMNIKAQSFTPPDTHISSLIPHNLSIH